MGVLSGVFFGVFICLHFSSSSLYIDPFSFIIDFVLLVGLTNLFFFHFKHSSSVGSLFNLCCIFLVSFLGSFFTSSLASFLGDSTFGSIFGSILVFLKISANFSYSLYILDVSPILYPVIGFFNLSSSHFLYICFVIFVFNNLLKTPSVFFSSIILVFPGLFIGVSMCLHILANFL